MYDELLSPSLEACSARLVLLLECVQNDTRIIHGDDHESKIPGGLYRGKQGEIIRKESRRAQEFVVFSHM